MADTVDAKEHDAVASCSGALSHVRLCALVRACRRGVAKVAETTLPPLILGNCRLEIACGKLRPHARREYELCIRALPKQKIAQPLFSARSNQEIDVRDLSNMRGCGDGFSESFARKRATAHARRCFDHEVPRGVVDRNAQMHLAAARSRLLRRFNRALQRVTQAISATDYREPNSVLDTALRLSSEISTEQRHERGDFGLWATPIVG